MVVQIQTAGAVSTRPEHRAAMRRIYEEAFPPSERDEFEATQRDGRLALQVVAVVDDQLVGFAQTIDIPGTDWCLLEYMAVERSQRSKGVGSSLLARVLWECEEAGCRALLLEVEHPSAAPNAEIARRRINFYKRHGATEVPGVVEYFIPDFTQPGSRLPMKLLAIPLRGELPTTREEVQALLSAMYTVAFGPDSAGQHLPDLLARVGRPG